MMRYTSHQSVEDIVVPIATIPRALSNLKEIGEKFGVAIPVLGHAGDGNLHAVPLKNPEISVEHWEEILPALLKDIYVMTAKLGGTISGEHGIGHKRRDYMSLVMSEAHLDMMRKIKRALDPKNILNPGKIFNLVCRYYPIAVLPSICNVIEIRPTTIQCSRPLSLQIVTRSMYLCRKISS